MNPDSKSVLDEKGKRKPTSGGTALSKLEILTVAYAAVCGFSLLAYLFDDVVVPLFFVPLLIGIMWVVLVVSRNLQTPSPVSRRNQYIAASIIPTTFLVMSVLDIFYGRWQMACVNFMLFGLTALFAWQQLARDGLTDRLK